MKTKMYSVELPIPPHKRLNLFAWCLRTKHPMPVSYVSATKNLWTYYFERRISKNEKVTVSFSDSYSGG